MSEAMTSIKTARRFELTAKSENPRQGPCRPKGPGAKQRPKAGRRAVCAPLNKVALDGERFGCTAPGHPPARGGSIDGTFERHAPHNMLQPTQRDQIPANLLDHRVTMRPGFPVLHGHLNQALAVAHGAQDQFGIELAAIEFAIRYDRIQRLAIEQLRPMRVRPTVAKQHLQGRRSGRRSETCGTAAEIQRRIGTLGANEEVISVPIVPSPGHERKVPLLDVEHVDPLSCCRA